MQYLLDTCVISDFVKGHSRTLSIIKDTNPMLISISSITVMEIEYGLAYNPHKASKIRTLIDDFLHTIKIVPFIEKEAKKAGEIRAILRAKGKPIGAYDILIAATALSNNMSLITSNIKEFERIDGLQIDNWR